MPSIFAYQSAEVDWCERNFEHSENIAEYYNTYSSIIFFILSPVILKLNVDYVNYRPEPLRCFSVMQMLIGLFSIYFHMTLSYVGQLLDELSILWGLSVCYGCWFPPRYFPGFIKNREQFLWLLAVMTILCTFLSFVKPVFNAYLLNCIALHLFYMTYLELRGCNNPRVHHLAVSMAILWGIAISCWLVDKLLCGFCQKINFTYFHSLWHIFIAISVQHCITLVIYFDVLFRAPGTQPQIVHWPCASSPVTLPYLSLQKP
ncbi:alkaline ceramidase 1 [Varanus komodoensis]|uniref:alkaline ceramidase 1 n=1 Tax=Varanus komodoensis TaxID=61221 RepID=UPI001CF78A09|nr:alkaline ceramidase 1 [Varanus komodoensis]